MSYNASELAPNITRAVRALREQYPNAPLYVAGHSMGAAMAHICALDLKFTLGFENVNVYSYGSPRVGNTIFKDFFNKIVNVSRHTLDALCGALGKQGWLLCFACLNELHSLHSLVLPAWLLLTAQLILNDLHSL